MSISDVEKDLLKRIDESRHWVETSVEITGLEVRGRDVIAIPEEFLDDEKRLERNGVDFKIRVVDPRQPITTRLRVRLKPERTEAAKEDSYPYLAVYVVYPDTDEEHLMVHDVLRDAERYRKPLATADIAEWYKSWLQIAMNRAALKLFANKARWPD